MLDLLFLTDTYTNDNKFILLITLIMWIVGIITAKLTRTTWLYSISGLLWFVPLFIIDNIFIVIFSIAIMIFHFIYAFTREE